MSIEIKNPLKSFYIQLCASLCVPLSHNIPFTMKMHCKIGRFTISSWSNYYRRRLRSTTTTTLSEHLCYVIMWLHEELS